MKVLRVDTEERKIGLSRRRVDWNEEQQAAAAKEEEARAPKEPSGDLKGGLGSGGLLISTGDEEKAEEAPKAEAAATAAVAGAAAATAAAPAKEEAPAEEKKEEAPAAEAEVKSPKGLGTDDLKVVEGIGPKCEEALKAAGIGSWKDLAGSTPEKITEILTAAEGNFAGQVPTTWPCLLYTSPSPRDRG